MHNETLTTSLPRDFRREDAHSSADDSPASPHDEPTSRIIGGLRAIPPTVRVGLILLLVIASTFVATRFLAPSFALATGSDRTTLALATSLGAALLMLAGYGLARTLTPRTPTRLDQLTTHADWGSLADSYRNVSGDLEARTLALQQEVARVNTILASIADGVIVRDNAGDIILMNAGASALLHKLPNFRQSELAKLSERHAGTDPSPDDASLPHTHRIELADRVLSVRASPVQTEAGAIIGEVLVMRDVTSEAAADRLKDDFVNSISHELRTPLTVIKGYSDVLMLGAQKGLEPIDLDRKLGEIYTHAESLERMIRQLIDLSEMAAGTLHLDARRINLNALLRETKEEWEERFQDAHQSVTLTLQGEKVHIEGDERRLHWALDAILQNARQYSPQPGELSITLSTLESAAVVQIKDTGVGVSGEDLPHVFERFYRGKPTASDGSVLDPRGVGQGLYVVKSVIEAHRGRVWIESDVGKGTVISILLPLSQNKH